ncbi:hypothetical protein GEMRC1_007432 [Eukaryota sp. GEM-RC1]
MALDSYPHQLHTLDLASDLILLSPITHHHLFYSSLSFNDNSFYSDFSQPKPEEKQSFISPQFCPPAINQFPVFRQDVYPSTPTSSESGPQPGSHSIGLPFFDQTSNFPQNASPSNSNQVTEKVIHSNVSSLTKPEDEVDEKGKKKPSNPYEEVLDDGYQWRKYGQKFSKNSPFPTCYYKCAYPNCSVKRQLQRDSDGNVVSIYRGKHNHSAPQVVKRTINTQEELVSLVAEHCVINENTSGDVLMRARSLSRSSSYADRRLILECEDTVDVFSDEFSWKKYGQKQVKGVALMRSYFKCAIPNCPAKKLVQKSSDNSSQSVVTYEHLHNHDSSTSKVTCTGPRLSGDSSQLCKRSNPGGFNSGQQFVPMIQVGNQLYMLNTNSPGGQPYYVAVQPHPYMVPSNGHPQQTVSEEESQL